MLIHIEPLGCGVFLPAFVIGYAVEDDDELEALDVAPLIVVLDQQAGGSRMQYPSMIGVVVRMEQNRDRGLRDLGVLVQGFRAMAEEPDLALLEREYPVLRALVQTKGAPYTPDELHSLDRYLADYLKLPPAARGIEACVQFADCDPRALFAQWHVMSCTLAVETRRRGSIYRSAGGAYHIDESNLQDIALDDNVPLEGGAWHELTRLRQLLRRPRPPQLFLLWENSD
jgi:hypothetical protein